MCWQKCTHRYQQDPADQASGTMGGVCGVRKSVASSGSAVPEGEEECSSNKKCST